jgi:hypothetical protein
MTLEKLLYDHLRADATLAGLTGGRVYIVQMPQQPVYPLIRYQRISTQRMYANTGASASTTWTRFQFDLAATGADGSVVALQLRDALLGALQNFDGSNQPASPAVPSNQAPNFALQEMMTAWPASPQPIFVYRVDVRIFAGKGA